MDRLECDASLFDLITNLSKEADIDLYLLQNCSKPSENNIMKIVNLFRNDGFFQFIRTAFFMFMICLERKIIIPMTASNAFSKPLKEKQLDPKIFTEMILLTPVFSKTMFSKKKILVSYGDADIKKVHELGLDLILRGNGFGIYKGKILSASNEGIISFHHGDNRWNRGGPHGFWEVYLKKPATGFIIQILNERLDDGDVIFRGEVPTWIFFTLNQMNILQIGNIFMERILKGYAITGCLPRILPKTPYSYMLLKSPKITQTLTYMAHTALMLTSTILKEKVLRRQERWSVAFVRSDWMISNLSKATVVKNPKGRFLADPFVATYGNQTVMFVEDYHYSTRRGSISAVRISPDGSYEFLSDVIRENFHLSFPYVFEYGSTLYMVPESAQAKAIRLYKCVQFPNHWEYLYDIMQDVDALDTMVFEHSGIWWMLTNMAPDGSSGQASQLCVFSANSPLSKDWQPHPKNPVCFSPELGRNGGLLKDTDGSIFRVRQKQGFNQYGIMFTIAKIMRLDLEFYEESTYCEVEPKFISGVVGTHHMHSHGGITVFDFVKEETIR